MRHAIFVTSIKETILFYQWPWGFIFGKEIADFFYLINLKFLGLF